LDPLDQQMARAGFEMVRYADDFVLLCRSEAEARRALERVQAWTAPAGLTLHPVKTRIVDARQPGGFDFLGYHFERGLRWPRRKSLDKLKDTIRAQTRRRNGQSLHAVIANLNRSLAGWFEYFKHSHRPTFAMVDKWVRMRMRRLLRQRLDGRGHHRGWDHLRWPNAFFHQRGLFSLACAPVLAGQSSRR
jgi:RNA-directed DNA polymerase